MKTKAYILLVVLSLTSCRTTPKSERPYQYEFHRAIASADRIVVHDGLAGVSGAEDATPQTYFVVTNKNEVASVLEHLDFHPVLQDNPCWCRGDFRIDWLKGNDLQASAWWKLGGLLWDHKNFASLTIDSRKWFTIWLKQHGLEWNSDKKRFEQSTGNDSE